jgi:hypothetical protein
VQVGVLDSLSAEYTNTENVPVATEARQAAAYPALLRFFACDPSVADVLLFLLIDQQDLRRFQSGLLRIDSSERPSFDTVRKAIGQLADCGVQRSWRHTERVAGARAQFGDQTAFGAKQSVLGLSVTAAEDATAKAGLFRVAGPDAVVAKKRLRRALDRAPGAGGPVLEAAARVRARFLPRLEVRGRLRRGYYRFVVRVRATINPARTSILVGPVISVG